MLTSALKDACINNSMIPRQLIAPICFYLHSFEYVRFPVKTFFSEQDHHLPLRAFLTGIQGSGVNHGYHNLLKHLWLTWGWFPARDGVLKRTGSQHELKGRKKRCRHLSSLSWDPVLAASHGGPGVAGSMLFYLKVWKVSLDFEREHMKNTYHGNLLGYDEKLVLFGEDLWELMDMFPIQALYRYCTIWLLFVYYMQG